jgi:hypothetical protein
MAKALGWDRVASFYIDLGGSSSSERHPETQGRFRCICPTITCDMRLSGFRWQACCRSRLPSRCAAVCLPLPDVRVWHLRDMPIDCENVRLRGESEVSGRGQADANDPERTLPRSLVKSYGNRGLFGRTECVVPLASRAAASCNSRRNSSRFSWIEAMTDPAACPNPISAASDS